MATKSPNQKSFFHAISVDIEDWFCNPEIPEKEWPYLVDRAYETTIITLDFLDQFNIKATFFISGYISRAKPQLVAKIASLGHEIASHGMLHKQLYDQSPKAFIADIRESKKILEDISGKAIIGYRAPLFTLNKTTSWAHPLIKEAGFFYSSSVYPTWNPVYGWPGFNPKPHKLACGLVEFPLMAIWGLPLGGGMYLRILPLFLHRMALWLRKCQSLPGIIYFHPWELDPLIIPHPMPLFWTFTHYFGLKNMRKRLYHLVEDGKFLPIQDILLQRGLI